MEGMLLGRSGAGDRRGDGDRRSFGCCEDDDGDED